MKKILVNFVHPNLEESRINKALLEEISHQENITVNNLYQAYGDFKIDAKKEQALLLAHDVIVFQFPMYWFSSPALLKEWFDVVLAYDFAYGKQYSLEGKIFAVATSAGASKEEYDANENGIEAFLLPFLGTASYTKMQYVKPFITYETYIIKEDELKKIASNYSQYIQELSK